jgi:hypothetical protein
MTTATATFDRSVWAAEFRRINRFHGRTKRYLPLTAHHEAGHAVAAIALRIPFTWVAVRPLLDYPDDDWVRYLRNGENFVDSAYGYVAAPPLGRWDAIPVASKMLVMTLAGPMAEYRSTGSRHRPRIRGKDRGDIIKLAALWVTGGWPRADDWPEYDRLIRGSKSRALALVDERWTEVRAVASALMEKRFLTRREVGKIVRGARSQ